MKKVPRWVFETFKEEMETNKRRSKDGCAICNGGEGTGIHALGNSFLGRGTPYHKFVRKGEPYEVVDSE